MTDMRACVGTCACGVSLVIGATRDVVLKLIYSGSFGCPHCADPIVRWYVVPSTRTEVTEAQAPDDYEIGS